MRVDIGVLSLIASANAGRRTDATAGVLLDASQLSTVRADFQQEFWPGTGVVTESDGIFGLPADLRHFLSHGSKETAE
jgi:hypothetical protein